MKRAVFAAAALALMAGGAHSKDLLTSGVWTTYAHQSQELCGMYTRVQGDNANGEIHLKYEKSVGSLYLQFFKKQWDFRTRGRIVNAVVTFDTVRHDWQGRTAPKNGGADAFVEFQISPAYSKDLLELFAESNVMTIEWPDGNEPNWISSMEGSRDVSWVFGGCMKTFGGDTEATKPF
jgi:hypothetical protein